jgi:hypothetical protein
MNGNQAAYWMSMMNKPHFPPSAFVMNGSQLNALFPGPSKMLPPNNFISNVPQDRRVMQGECGSGGSKMFRALDSKHYEGALHQTQLANHNNGIVPPELQSDQQSRNFPNSTSTSTSSPSPTSAALLDRHVSQKRSSSSSSPTSITVAKFKGRSSGERDSSITSGDDGQGASTKDARDTLIDALCQLSSNKSCTVQKSSSSSTKRGMMTHEAGEANHPPQPPPVNSDYYRHHQEPPRAWDPHNPYMPAGRYDHLYLPQEMLSPPHNHYGPPPHNHYAPPPHNHYHHQRQQQLFLEQQQQAHQPFAHFSDMQRPLEASSNRFGYQSDHPPHLSNVGHLQGDFAVSSLSSQSYDGHQNSHQNSFLLNDTQKRLLYEELCYSYGKRNSTFPAGFKQYEIESHDPNMKRVKSDKKKDDTSID